MENNKPHYAWLVCFGCALLLFCTSGLAVNAFSIYQPYILERNHFTNAQSSLIITFRNLASLCSMLLAGRFYRRVSLRTGMLLAGLSTALSFFLFALAGSFPMYCIAGAVIGIGYGLGTMIPVAIVLEHWFYEKRNTAIGLCSAVTGLSTLGIPSLLSRSVERNGLRWTFFCEAAVVFILILLSFLLIRSNPEDRHSTPYGYRQIETSQQHSHPVGLRRRDWFFLLPAILLTGAVMNVAYSHLAVLMSGEGIDSATIAIAISVSGIALMLGKILYGRLGDVIGNFRSNFCFIPFLLVGLLLCCFVGRSLLFLYAAMLFYSIGISFLAIGLASWAGDLSAEGQHDRTVQVFQTAYSAGSLLFSFLPGILADYSGGSYVPAYLLFLLFAVVVCLTIQWMYIRVQKRRNSAFPVNSAENEFIRHQ